MNEKYLRIGNYIQLYRNAEDKEMSIHKVKAIFYSTDYSCYCVELEDTFVVNIERGIEPIPLTEEWLLKFGFKKNSEFYENGKVILIEENNSFHLAFLNCSSIKYVHQLQNLYFALCGEELQLQ